MIEYECSSGHYHRSRHPLTQCQAYILGVRCPGEMVRVGKGSRPRKRKEVDA